MFLTVLWQAGTLGTFHPQMAALFVSSLAKKLAARDPSVRTMARDILNALTALETLVPGSLSKDKDMDYTGIWLASLDSDPENLLDACMYLPGPITPLTLSVPFSCVCQLCGYILGSSQTRRSARVRNLGLFAGQFATHLYPPLLLRRRTHCAGCCPLCVLRDDVFVPRCRTPSECELSELFPSLARF